MERDIDLCDGSFVIPAIVVRIKVVCSGQDVLGADRHTREESFAHGSYRSDTANTTECGGCGVQRAVGELVDMSSAFRGGVVPTECRASGIAECVDRFLLVADCDAVGKDCSLAEDSRRAIEIVRVDLKELLGLCNSTDSYLKIASELI